MKASLSSVLRLADQMAQTHIAQLRGALDDMSSMDGGPFDEVGATVPRAAYRLLLGNDPATQQHALAVLPYLTQQEKESLARELQRALPGPADLPASVTQAPLLPHQAANLTRVSTGGGTPPGAVGALGV